MNMKPKLYEVGYQITEHRSIMICARSEAEAIESAKALDDLAPDNFDVTTGVPECWAAHIVEP